MRQDPDLTSYLNEFYKNYKLLNDEFNLASYFLNKSHQLLEATCPIQKFKRVLELGAGPIPHLSYVKHEYEEYWVTDISPFNETTLQYKNNNRVHIKKEDATKLTFKNESIDRIVAAHLLEHLPNPHEVLREWVRVLKPKGILSIILPCDPGLLWELGRSFGPRRRAHALGIDYNYWMAREHINSIQNLKALLDFYFKDLTKTEMWYPFFIPITHLNLFYITHITKAG